jgi:hypothetical protein
MARGLTFPIVRTNTLWKAAVHPPYNYWVYKSSNKTRNPSSKLLNSMALSLIEFKVVLLWQTPFLMIALEEY